MNIKDSGFGIVEVIVALGLFLVIVTSGLTTVTGTFSSNRLSQESYFANQLAQSGLEIARSMKNFSWDTGLNSTSCASGCGLSLGPSGWQWQGSSNILDKYTRVVKVEDVNRDGSGTIVSSGGTNDTDTKKVTSTVTWSHSPTRNNNVTLITYLTNFRKSISSIAGYLIYGDTTTTPKVRTYDTSADQFAAASPSVAGSSGLTFTLRASPKGSELVAGYVNSAGTLQIMCFNGSTWSSDWSVAVGGNGSTRRFDIAYETNSGDAIVMYSTNTATTNEIAFRTKASSSGCGSANWSTATNFNPARTSGIVQWVKIAWDKRVSSDLLAAIWADANSDLSGAMWNGTAWVNEPTTAMETSLEVVSVAQDIDNFDVEFESLSGDVMVVWGNSAGRNGTNGVRYRTCTGGLSTCTWSAITTPPTFSDDATHLDISANPQSNEIVFASIGNGGSDLQAGYWSGTAWTNRANLDTSCITPTAGRKIVATAWLVSGSTSRSLIRYADQGSANLDWYIGNLGVFTAQTDFAQSPAPNGPNFIDVQMNPQNPAEVMSFVSDANSDLFAKRLIMTSTPTFTWTNSDGTALTTTLGQAFNSPFSFTYLRQ